MGFFSKQDGHGSKDSTELADLLRFCGIIIPEPVFITWVLWKKLPFFFRSSINIFLSSDFNDKLVNFITSGPLLCFDSRCLGNLYINFEQKIQACFLSHFLIAPSLEVFATIMPSFFCSLLFSFGTMGSGI